MPAYQSISEAIIRYNEGTEKRFEDIIRSLTVATASSSKTNEPASRFSVASNPHCFSGVQYGQTPSREEHSPDFHFLFPVAIRCRYQVLKN